MKIGHSGFVAPAPDFDGDDMGDILLNLRRDGVFVAFSGKTGKVLWRYPEGRGESRNGPLPRLLRTFTAKKLIVGEPVMTDVDRDGTPDLIATIILGESSDKQNRVVAGLSGRSGKEIWMHGIDEELIHVSAAYLDRPAVLVQGRDSRLVGYVDGSEVDIGIHPESGRGARQADSRGAEPGCAGAARGS